MVECKRGCPPQTRMVFIWTLVLVATACPAFAATPAGREKLRGAIERAIPLLEKSSAGSADNRTCFTCHHQALPVMALHEARGRGLAIDEQNFRKQVEHTRKHLERGRANYERGKGQGGQAGVRKARQWCCWRAR